MKKIMMFGLALVMAFTLAIPAIYAQQHNTQPAQTGGWYCPVMNHAQQSGWQCPMMRTGAPGGWQSPMMNQKGGNMGGMMMGRGCMMMHNTQSQPPAQQ